jgi:hypothetical protein
MEQNFEKIWDGMGYEEQEYNKPIGKTIFNLIVDEDDDNDEYDEDYEGDREVEYYSLEDVLNERDEYQGITYTIFFDTDKPPFAYEFGTINFEGEMIPHWRAGYKLKLR